MTLRIKEEEICRPIGNGCLIPNTPCFVTNTGNVAFFHLKYDVMFLLHERYAKILHGKDTTLCNRQISVFRVKLC